MIKVSAKYTKLNGGIETFNKVATQNLKNAQKAMANSILNTAMMKAPVLTGALKSDGRIEYRNADIAVVFGDERVPYARLRHFENRKNPQTKYYLSNAGDQIMKKGIQSYL